jgi:hypothetical protein
LKNLITILKYWILAYIVERMIPFLYERGFIVHIVKKSLYEVKSIFEVLSLLLIDMNAFGLCITFVCCVVVILMQIGELLKS